MSMDPRDRTKLQLFYTKLREDVIYSHVSAHLISSFVLTMEMHEEINSKPTERQKMEKLLSILPSRGREAMGEFIEALRPAYGWLATELERDENGGRERVRNVNNNNENRNMQLPNLPEVGITDYVREIARILYRNPRASSHWTLLANSMQLMPTTIMDIKRDMFFYGGCEHAIMSVLNGWISKVGNNQATFSKLIGILNREGMRNCGEDVLEYWEAIVGNGAPENQYIQQQHTNIR